MPLLNRLCGLETEYAMRIRRGNADEPARFELFTSLIAALGKRVLTVPAHHFKDGIFTANGGAVWFEAERPALGGGLIEGSTPECRHPRQLVTYQRAQDLLLADAAQAASSDIPFQLIKNDRDAFGNVYGAQENYQVTLAQGLDLWVWRIGLLLLLPLLVLTWLGFIGILVLSLVYLIVAGMTFFVLQAVHPRPQQLARNLFGQDLAEGRETGKPFPAWAEAGLIWLTRIITAPLAIGLWTLIQVAAFRKTRRLLTPFLLSRAVISGTGMIDDQGKFQLADKAPAMNCLVGYGGVLWDRPMFSMGHLLKALCGEGRQIPSNYRELFRGTYRLQIALGDSNMCEVSEYLRVGTTMLVLDALEGGYLDGTPRGLRPLRSLRSICADPSLSTKVTLSNQQQVTAVELQRYYCQACQRMLQEHPAPPEEALEIAGLWSEVLWDLEDRESLDEQDTSLVGSIDWVTKKYLLDQASTDAPWELLKKIDIRYHELSPDGYFATLNRAGMVRSILDPERMEQAMRNAPPYTPATTRSHYIREFSQGVDNFRVNWKTVRFTTDGQHKRVCLSSYGGSPAQRPNQITHGWSTDDAESEPS